MNREDTKKAVEVMQHWVNGGEIEAKDKRASPSNRSQWYTCLPTDMMAWDHQATKYRIKPKAKEVFLEIAMKNGEILGVHNTNEVLQQNPISRFHLFREVL